MTSLKILTNMSHLLRIAAFNPTTRAVGFNWQSTISLCLLYHCSQACLGVNYRFSVKLSTITALAAKPHTSLVSVDAQVLAELFDHAPDLAFYVKDAAGCYVAVNESLIKRHGLRHKAQAIGRRPCEFCAGDFGRIPSEQDAEVLRSGRPLLDHLEQQWYVPQKPVWCLTTKLPLRDSAGNIIGLIGISRDVRAPVNLRDIPPGLAAALEYFEKNLADPVSPAALAKRAKITPAKLARLIRRFFDLTPSQFITQTRLALAARLLRESDCPVADIAHECGFYDHSAFARAFRAAMGVTPSEFRHGVSTSQRPCGRGW
jgi:AraC-like DNA-binding protein/PAS domain-containing protein